MPIVSATFIPGTNATGVAISNTPLMVVSLDVVPLSSNNSATTPNIGGSAGACLFPLSWSKASMDPLIDLNKVFIKAGNNTDGVAYIYSTP